MVNGSMVNVRQSFALPFALCVHVSAKQHTNGSLQSEFVVNYPLNVSFAPCKSV